jgi:hypothetical protein
MARLRPPPRRPAPPPLETNDVGVAAAGTVAWLIALLVLLVVDLPEGATWWRWVCVTGIGIGLFATWYVPRLQRNRAADARRRAEAKAAAVEGQSPLAAAGPPDGSAPPADSGESQEP